MDTLLYTNIHTSILTFSLFLFHAHTHTHTHTHTSTHAHTHTHIHTHTHTHIHTHIHVHTHSHTHTLTHTLFRAHADPLGPVSCARERHHTPRPKTRQHPLCPRIPRRSRPPYRCSPLFCEFCDFVLPFRFV
jgi:hypothetical protein